MALIDDTYALIVRGPSFRIAAFIPHVTVEAVGQDALGITGFPVESGAVTTDHSFKMPVRCEMVVGWSDSSAQTNGYVQQVYSGLLSLQATRRPFDIYTSRRVYRSMLMESIVDPIGASTMYSMLPRIGFRELIISRTQTTGSNSSSAGSPAANNADQAEPQRTGGTLDRGTVQPDLVNFSGNGTTPYGGYDPRLGIAAATAVGSLDGMYVEGLGEVDVSGLGEKTSTTDPSTLGGNPGLFGRYSPGAFADVQSFRI